MALRQEEEARVRMVMDLIFDVLVDSGIDVIKSPPSLEKMKQYLVRAVRIAKLRCDCGGEVDRHGE